MVRGSAGVEKMVGPSCSEFILHYTILGGLDSQKLVGSGPVKPMRWLRL